MLKYTLALLLSLNSFCVFANIEDEKPILKPNVELLETDQDPVEVLALNSSTSIVSLPSSLKATAIGYNFDSNTSTFSQRSRTALDTFEITCLVKQETFKSQPQSISCITENDDNSINLIDGTKLIASFKPASDIDMVELNPGVKLASFNFDMDGVQKTTTTTKIMLNTDKPQIYAIFRFSNKGNSWSGKRLLFIREHR